MSDSTRDDSTRGGASGANRRPPGATWGRWRPAAAFAAVVLAASVVPVPGGSGGAGGGFGIGRGVLEVVVGVLSPTDPFHLVGYAVLAALSARATDRDVRGLVVAATVAVAFGFGVELVQTAIPWRTFAWRDSLVNAVGATAGVAVEWVRRRGMDI